MINDIRHVRSRRSNVQPKACPCDYALTLSFAILCSLNYHGLTLSMITHVSYRGIILVYALIQNDCETRTELYLDNV